MEAIAVVVILAPSMFVACGITGEPVTKVTKKITPFEQNVLADAIYDELAEQGRIYGVEMCL